MMRMDLVRIAFVLPALLSASIAIAQDSAPPPPQPSTQPGWDAREKAAQATTRPHTQSPPAPLDNGWRLGDGTELRHAWDALEFEPAPSLKHLVFLDENAAVEKRLTDKKLVIAFFSPTAAPSVQAIDDLAAKYENLGSDVEVLAILARTGETQLQKFAETKKWPFVLAADPGEASMGFKVGPLNKLARFYVVDSMGFMRVAAANPNALPDIIKSLNNEPAWPVYPPFPNVPTSCVDVQGTSIPKFDTLEWVTPKPNTSGKIILMYMLETNYLACSKALPKVDELLKSHHELTLIAISHEPTANIKRFLAKNNYDGAFAADPKRTVEKAIQNGGPNYLYVATPDGTIRWQGIGTKITDEEIQKIIDADPAKILVRLKEMKVAAEKERRKIKMPVATTQP